MNSKKLYTKASQTKIRNVYMSLISELYLSSSVYRASTAYTSICRGLKYLLKIRNIILIYTNVCPDFWFSKLFILAGRKHYPMSKNNITKMNDYVSDFNVHILVCRHARSDCRLWNVLQFDCVFGNFHKLLHVWNVITS